MIYFDNAASTRPAPEVRNIIAQCMEKFYANPSAKHRFGLEAHNRIREAARIIAAHLKVSEKEIIFTSGGTEANNLALLGSVLANPRNGKHLLCSAIEHAAVYEPLSSLKEKGYETEIIPVDRRGQIDPEALAASIRPDTALVSVMHVNNEIGSIAPLSQIGKRIKKKNPNILFHVDAVQSIGKLPVFPKRWEVDLLSASAHKFHGPKGAGFLYCREGVRLLTQIHGGGQQRKLRSGTLDVYDIAGMGEAVRLLGIDWDKRIAHMTSIKNNILSRMERMPGVILNSYPDDQSAPHIVSISVEGIPSEILLHALEEREIYVASGSACSSSHPGISGTLHAIGLGVLAQSTIRVSLSEDNTLEEAECFGDAMEEILRELAPIRKR